MRSIHPEVVDSLIENDIPIPTFSPQLARLRRASYGDVMLCLIFLLSYRPLRGV